MDTLTLTETERGAVLFDPEQGLIFIEFRFWNNEKPNSMVFRLDDFGEYSRLVTFGGVYFHCPQCLRDLADDIYNFADDMEREMSEENGE